MRVNRVEIDHRYFFYLITFGLFLMGFSGSVWAGEEEKHLIILSGQSNMVRMDPQRTFIPALQKVLGDRFIVVKDAKGARPIRRWYIAWEPAWTLEARFYALKRQLKIWLGRPVEDVAIANGDLYQRLMKKVYPAIAGKKITTVTLVWMQGERDARFGYGEVYAESLKGLIQQFADDLGVPHINVVIGRISDFDMNNQWGEHWTMVRAAQEQVAASNPCFRLINTDDLNGASNGIHYTRKGYDLLGKRFAAATLELIRLQQQQGLKRCNVPTL